jgi:hypothetical protein
VGYACLVTIFEVFIHDKLARIHLKLIGIEKL